MKYFVSAALVFFLVSLFLLVGDGLSGSAEDKDGQLHSKFIKPSEVRGSSNGDPKLTVAEKNKIDDLLTIDVDEIFPNPSGFVYRSIDELDHDDDLMRQLREDLANFKKYGSIGKGKITVQFSNTKNLMEVLEKRGLQSILNGLAFNPVQISGILGSGFLLVGADDQGKLISDCGWSGYFQFADLHQSRRSLPFCQNALCCRLP